VDTRWQRLSIFVLRRIDYIEKETSMETNRLPRLDNVFFGEIQVVLAEKTTAQGQRVRSTRAFAFVIKSSARSIPLYKPS
jgi:hypothetical protein